MSKEMRLTNWQVPRDPRMVGRDALFQAAAKNPLDIRKYESVGGVEHHETTESVAAKMIAKQEAARGVKIDREEPTPTSNLSMGGVVDDRKDKVYFKLGVR